MMIINSMSFRATRNPLEHVLKENKTKPYTQMMIINPMSFQDTRNLLEHVIKENKNIILYINHQ